MKRVVLLLLFSVTLFAQEKPVTISGYLFGDYYAAVAHHDPAVEGQNGFWLRRGYVTFDRALSDALSARLRFEVNSPGDFRTNTTLEPYVKDAYVRWRRSPAFEAIVGISPTPAYEVIERVWGYRHLERTPLDLQRLESSRDFGVSVMGTRGISRYHLMFGNGAGTGAETNEGKKIGAAYGVSPTKATFFEVFANYEDRPGANNRATLQGFGALQYERWRAGLQYARQMRQSGSDIDIASLFAVYNLNERFALVGRVDRMFDPNPEADRIAYLPMDPTRESTLLIAALDWKLHKNLSVLPNVEYVRYADGGDDDVMPRLTLYFTF